MLRRHEWEELSGHTDVTLRRVLSAAVAEHTPISRLALLAVGGYGRRELAPFSDLDVLLVHESKRIQPAFGQALWYPLWDGGHKVGHAVRTPRDTVAMARSDLDTAAAIVTARVVAGDHEFGEGVVAKAHRVLRRRGRDLGAPTPRERARAPSSIGRGC